jgi:hypothetical protein
MLGGISVVRITGIRRLCVGVDLHKYSGRDSIGQHAAQRRLREVLDDAAEKAGLPQGDIERLNTGDGEIALFPPEIDEPEVIADLIRQTRVELFQVNRDLSDSARLRLRMALHHGLTYKAEVGYAGDAINHLARLLDAPPLKVAMKNHDNTDLGLIVADALFQEVIKHNPADLRAADFERVEVGLPDKGFSAVGWMSLPDRRPPAAPAAPGATRPDPHEPEQGSDARTPTINQYGKNASATTDGDITNYNY